MASSEPERGTMTIDTSDASDIEDPKEIPNLQEELPELRLYSHSPLFYWWPVWLVGFILCAVSLLAGRTVQLGGESEVILASSNAGMIYIAVLLAVVVFTNVRLRGIYSVLTVVSLLFIAVLFAWLGVWDTIFALVPEELSVHMNAGFYLIMSLALLIIWALAFFVGDRMTYWSIRPGQMVEERVIGDRERSFDTRGMLFEKRGEDLFRHKILGLGTGDLEITTTGARKEVLHIRNVTFVDSKIDKIQRLISVQPDDLLDKTKV